MFSAQVAAFIAQHQLLAPSARVVVGLSGGVDSAVLTHVLVSLGYRVTAVHVNYGLRGADSDGDEAFVASFCARYAIPLVETRPDTLACAGAAGRSVQEAARLLRYEAFTHHAQATKAAHVAVGHHIDDQAETVLLQLFRGAGPEGLAGMPVRRRLASAPAVDLVRPLLGVRRAAIEAYARDEGLAWREDASNEGMAYRRARLRTAILPMLEAAFGEAVIPNINRAAKLVRALQASVLREALAEHFEACGYVDPAGGGHLALDGLQALDAYWRRRLILEALSRWLPDVPRTYATAARIDALLAAQPGRMLRWKNATVWRGRVSLRFVPAEAPAASGPAADGLLQPGRRLHLPAGSLTLDVGVTAPPDPAAEAPGTVYLDADRLVLPLKVRRWRAGDRLQPLGMDGTKKVSDLLTDARVPVEQKRGVHVVLSGDQIVWVVGVRPADAARLRADTRQIAKISYQSGKMD